MFMKKICAFFSLMLLLCTQLTAQTWQWTHPEPNGTATYPNDNDYAQKLITDTAGNVYELGQYSGDLYLTGTKRTTGNGSFIAKYNSNGKLLWFKLIAPVTAGAAIAGGDIVITNNKLFLTATYSGSGSYCPPGQPTYYQYNLGSYVFSTGDGDVGMLFACFDLNGNFLWNKTANALRISSDNCRYPGVAIDLPPLLAADKNGNVIIAFENSAYDNQGFTLGGDFIADGYISDIWGCKNINVIKYNSSGNIIWSNYGYEQIQNENDVFVKSLVTDNSGNAFINTRLNDSFQLGNLMFHTNSIYDGAGDSAFATSVLIKISASGTWNFVKEIASVTQENDGYRSQNIAVDNANNVYLTEPVVYNCSCGPGVILGDTIPASPGEGAIYLVKLDNSGNAKWKKVFGDDPFTYPWGGGPCNGFVIDNNNLYIAGYLYQSSDYTPSYLFAHLTVPYIPGEFLFIAKADTSGDFKWVTTAYGGGMYSRSITAHNGSVYMSGDYRSSVTNLGDLNGTFINPDNYTYNMFLGKLTDQFIKVGALTPTTLCPGSNLTIPFTSHGLTFTTNNKFTAELSDVNGDFTTPIAIGSVKSTGNGSITAVIPSTVPYAKGYRVRIRSSDTLKTGYNYFAYADTDYIITLLCPAPSSGFAATNVTGTTATLKWNAVDCAKGYRIQYRIKGTTKWITVATSSNADTLNLIGLTVNTTYQWHIATKCKPSVVVYSSYSAIKQFTTAASFVLSSTINEADAESKTSSITVYPNPANKTATVQVNSSKVNNYSLELTDISGKTLQTKTGSLSAGSNQIMVDVSKYASGMYMINLTDEEHGRKVLKLNKE
jgi:hypothetical protein